MSNKRIGELSQEALDQLKEKYSRIYLIEVEDESETHCLYLRRPDFNTIKAVGKVAKDDPLESSRILLVNCKVAGSDTVLEDGVLLMAAGNASSELLISAKAHLKNV